MTLSPVMVTILLAPPALTQSPPRTPSCIKVQFTVGGQPVPAGQCAHISDDGLTMPDLGVGLITTNGSTLSGSVSWRMTVAFDRKATSERTPFTDHTTATRSGTLPVNSIWKPYSDPNTTFTSDRLSVADGTNDVSFQGGNNVVAYWSLGSQSGQSDPYNFCIDGPPGNPSSSVVLGYSKSLTNFWAWAKMIHEESSFNQFCPAPSGTYLEVYVCQRQNIPNRWPMHTSDYGYGLAQLTNPNPLADAVWNWQYNLFAGVQILQQKYLDATLAWAGYVNAYNAYNSLGGVFVLTPEDVYCSWQPPVTPPVVPYWACYNLPAPAGAPAPNCIFSYLADGVSNHFFQDAITIARYNGSPDFMAWDGKRDIWVLSSAKHVPKVCQFPDTF